MFLPWFTQAKVILILSWFVLNSRRTVFSTLLNISEINETITTNAASEFTERRLFNDNETLKTQIQPCLHQIKVCKAIQICTDNLYKYFGIQIKEETVLLLSLLDFIIHLKTSNDYLHTSTWSYKILVEPIPVWTAHYQIFKVWI